MSSELLDPRTLTQLGNLTLCAKTVVSGVLTGLHRSPQHGSSVEFAEHKEYSPGDEIRHIDWKVYGKFDRYYVKRFEHETNLRAYILLDVSGSMGFASDGVSKLRYGKLLAASLAYLLLRQQDAAGLLLFAQDLRRELPPSSRGAHLNDMVTLLDQAEPRGETDVASALSYVAESASRRSLAIIISDMFDPDPQVEAALRQFKARRHELALFHVLDRAELDFPYEDPTRFESMEDDRFLFAHPRALRSAYLQEMHAFQEGFRRLGGEIRMDYVAAHTDTAPGQVLLEFLKTRR